MTDTVPEAITQADRDAVQAFHRTMAARLMLDIKNPDRPRLGEDEGDAGTLVQAFARHRRLASQDAGEGLREAVITAARDLVMVPGGLKNDGKRLYVVESRDKSDPHYRLCRAFEALDAFTPPSDAGSTTREGGEGVFARALAEWGEEPEQPDSTPLWAHPLAMLLTLGDIRRAALATTPSPGASPDSGEANKAALLMEALNNPEPVKIGEGEYAYAKVEELPAMLRGMVSDGLFFQCEPHVTIDAWNIARMAADELEARLASPASLSGGAEAFARQQADHWLEDMATPVLSARHVSLVAMAGNCIRYGQAHPSPEAPANRQEAGEVAPDEDWLTDVIDDSLDMDWTGRVGARAIIARWSERHD